LENIPFVPFCRLGRGEPYQMYFDIADIPISIMIVQGDFGRCDRGAARWGMIICTFVPV
jgi:hypothetical protein